MNFRQFNYVLLLLFASTQSSFAEGQAGMLAELNLDEASFRDLRYVFDFGAYMPARNSAIIGDQIIFDADDNLHGTELWISDGTTIGTRLLADLNPGLRSSLPTDMVAFDDKVIFVANDGSWGSQLWVSDGTELGTQRLTDQLRIYNFFLSSNSIKLQQGLGGVVFAASTKNSHGIWKSDGTPEGTQLLWQPDFPAASSILAATPSQLMISVNRSETGLEPWVINSDGSAVFLGDLNPGVDSSIDAYVEQHAMSYQGGFLFTATNTENGKELWHTQGSPETTELLLDIRSGEPGSDPVLLGLNGENILISFKQDDTSQQPVLAKITESLEISLLRDEEERALFSP